MRRTAHLVFIVLCLGMVLPAGAQVPLSFYDYVRSDLRWFTLETEHFQIHFHSESEEQVPWTATEIARVAESVYDPITDLYDHRPSGKTNIIVRDFEDYSNGAAYFFDNMIVIWAPALNSPLRGRHEWIRNVIAHEFTHIVQVQATLKSGRKRPFVYLQVIDYEDVRRPDVLYGYPNVIITYPLPSISNPAWLAEGTAQFQRSSFAFDTWDTHRDMLLRTRVLANEELSLSDMGGFYSHTSLERETVYNQGFAFTLYLAHRFGEDILAEISGELGKWRHYNVERAIEAATDIPAQQIYDDWIDELEQHYKQEAAQIRDTTAYTAVTAEGFFNFHPHLSPDGKRVAYLTNGSSGEGTTHLHVSSLDADPEIDAMSSLEVDLGFVGGYQCAFGHRLVPAVTDDIDWSHDGERVVYARRRDTPEGYLYSDLYEITLDSEESTQLTERARAIDPAYHPTDSTIVFVSQTDGTSNLNLLSVADKTVRAITSYDQGNQVYEPDWSPDGKWIYFGKSDTVSSGIYRLEVQSGRVETVIDEPADERSPAIGPDGAYLYYASDVTGIFNIYRRDLSTGEAVPVTNVVGGAFMPNVSGGKIAYANYRWDGYDIVWIDAEDVEGQGSLAAIDPPGILSKTDEPVEVLSDQSGNASLIREGDREATGYRPQFTSFSFYPAIRLDQYVTRERNRDAAIRRGRAETLARNTKVGFYVNSREILDELSFFAGLLVGPASRSAESLGDYIAPASLLKLERDLFVQFDYRKGLFFSGKRWSPQLSLELFNISRNVDDGLSIEEFSCTACFPPDTTFADISYNLWELNLTARSKISRTVLAEAGYRYSPYRVTTERFFSAEFQESIAESSSRYFIGKAVWGGVRYEVLRRYVHADVLPAGLKTAFSYEMESGRLLDRFDVENGVLEPVFESSRVHRLTLDATYSRLLPGRLRGAPHGAGLRIRSSSIIGPVVDSFYNDYVGGLAGARGYPFYALGGNETFWAHLYYTLPIFPSIKKQIGFVYVDKLFLKTYVDAALAWDGALPSIGSLRKDAGAELRLVTGSFYLLPSAIFISGTYGLDEFEFRLDEAFVTPGTDETVRYGKSFQVHAGVLFSFDF